jgi:hypothetical protein
VISGGDAEKNGKLSMPWMPGTVTLASWKLKEHCRSIRHGYTVAGKIHLY